MTFIRSRSDCAFKLAHGPNIHRLEIEVTTRCDLMCRHCDRRCSQAPANEDIELEVIERFLAESRRLGHRWDMITLLGGEPTMHPHLKSIIERISSGYVQEVEDCRFFLVSNCYSKETKEKLISIEPFIVIKRRPKSNHEAWFTNMDLAPVDFVSVATSCPITAVCGLGLTRSGYYPCGAGAAIARALDLDIGVKSLHDVTEESMAALLARLCQYCGHALGVEAGAFGLASRFWQRERKLYHLRRDMSEA